MNEYGWELAKEIVQELYFWLWISLKALHFDVWCHPVKFLEGDWVFRMWESRKNPGLYGCGLGEDIEMPSAFICSASCHCEVSILLCCSFQPSYSLSPQSQSKEIMKHKVQSIQKHTHPFFCCVVVVVVVWGFSPIELCTSFHLFS